MKIEQVTANDTHQLKILARESIHASVEANTDVKKEIVIETEKHIDRYICQSGQVFIKCSESTILGFCLVQHHWNLSDLFVHPSAQGRGVGQLLLGEVKLACKKHRSTFIRVNSSLNAERFYRKHGFVSCEIENKTPDFVVPLIYNLET